MNVHVWSDAAHRGACRAVLAPSALIAILACAGTPGGPDRDAVPTDTGDLPSLDTGDLPPGDPGDLPGDDTGPVVPVAVFVSEGVARDVRVDGAPWTSAGGWLDGSGCDDFLHGGRRVLGGDFHAALTLKASPPDGARIVLRGNNRIVVRDQDGRLALEGPLFDGDLETLGPSPVLDGVPFTVEIVREGDTLRLVLDGVELRRIPFADPVFGTIGLTPGLANWFLGLCGSETTLSVSDFRVQGATAPLPPAPPRTDLYRPGDDGYAAFRIPAVSLARAGTILAFAEGRKDDIGDSGDIDTVVRRSTDGGATWDAIRVVCDRGTDTCGNPVPILDRDTGTVWLVLSTNPGSLHETQINAGQGTRNLWVTSSGDDGLTWSDLRSIDEGVREADWRWVANGPGHGIQLASGRLVSAGNYTVGGKAGEGFSFVLVSDDHGATWRRGGVVPGGYGDESTVAERADGSLLLAFRSKYDVYRRGVATSTDGGETWTAGAPDPALIEPHCEGSLLRVRDPAWPVSPSGVLLFSNPASTQRELLSLRASLDGGATWPVFQWLHPGPAAYSDLVELAGGSIGVLFERGEASPYDAISFAVAPPAWILDGYGPQSAGRAPVPGAP